MKTPTSVNNDDLENMNNSSNNNVENNNEFEH